MYSYGNHAGKAGEIFILFLLKNSRMTTDIYTPTVRRDDSEREVLHLFPNELFSAFIFLITLSLWDWNFLLPTFFFRLSFLRHSCVTATTFSYSLPCYVELSDFILMTKPFRSNGWILPFFYPSLQLSFIAEIKH